MSTKNLPLFATTSDLLEVVREVDAARPLQFVAAGLFDQSEPQLVEKAQLESLNRYIVMDRGATVRVESVPQRRGGTLYAVDQSMNPDSVGLSMGGLLEAGHLLAGHVGTASVSPISLQLCDLFAKSIRRHFERIKSYRVGREAARLLDQGVRLTATKKGPATYDLTRE